ncbi:MAG: ABC transporter ATP-binding protein [Clostridia bacterium]
MTTIEVKNLTKSYPSQNKKQKAFGAREKFLAVDDVSFDIQEGQIVGLLGANGAGKTTIIKMLCGLVSPTCGSIEICGANIAQDIEKALENIGAVIEEPTLYKQMTGMQNLEYFASLQGGVPRKRIEDIVAIVGMTDKINQSFGTYSLGMKQRVGIAQAIMHNPRVLILDEPTNGLDADGIVEMRVLLRELATKYGTTILISSHILSEMQELCDSVILMKDGKIISRKSVADILKEVVGKSVFKIACDQPEKAAAMLAAYKPQKVAVVESDGKVVEKENSDKADSQVDNTKVDNAKVESQVENSNSDKQSQQAVVAQDDEIETKVKDGFLYIRTSLIDGGQINKFLVENGFVVSSIATKPQTLEGYYRGLTNEK